MSTLFKVGDICKMHSDSLQNWGSGMQNQKCRIIKITPKHYEIIFLTGQYTGESYFFMHRSITLWPQTEREQLMEGLTL